MLLEQQITDMALRALFTIDNEVYELSLQLRARMCSGVE